MERRAKIVATLGPASGAPEVIRDLLAAGVDVVRLNLSHGSHDDHRTLLARLRQAAAEAGRLVPVILDLMGPRYRLGTIAGGARSLAAGEEVTIGGAGSGAALPVEEPGFLEHVQPGERLLIDNGRVELAVTRRGAAELAARVVHGGTVATRKGINLPDTELPFTISDKDRADVAFAVAEGADFLAVSFVGGPEDLEQVRAVVRRAGGLLPLVAKLERSAVLPRLAATVEAADAVMVARGDLGVEVPLHEVPVLQKKIVAVGRRLGKPVIVATQMLESMMLEPRPTRAEASDVANAVFDGADALMLSGETAAGRYPVEVVRTMARIIVEAEGYAAAAAPLPVAEPPVPLAPAQSEQEALRPGRDLHLEIPDVVAAAAVYAAGRLDVARIVAFSQGGFTARTIARYRPPRPLVVCTTDAAVARRVQLLWGARPLVMGDEVSHHDEVVTVVDRLLLDAGLARPGDVILILMGDPIAERPLTNLMRAHRVRGRRGDAAPPRISEGAAAATPGTPATG